MGFADNVRKRAEELKLFVKDDVERIALELYEKIRTKTPVDHGELRQSWVFNKIDDDTYIISTDKPYAWVLEYGMYPNPPKSPTGKTKGGFSVKAPNGFVRISIKEVANANQ